METYPENIMQILQDNGISCSYDRGKHPVYVLYEGHFGEIYSIYSRYPKTLDTEGDTEEIAGFCMETHKACINHQVALYILTDGHLRRNGRQADLSV